MRGENVKCYWNAAVLPSFLL